MSFLNRFSLDREKRLKEKRRRLLREQRIAALESEIDALETGRPPRTPAATTQRPPHNAECMRRYHKYGENHYTNDSCLCHLPEAQTQ